MDIVFRSRMARLATPIWQLEQHLSQIPKMVR